MPTIYVAFEDLDPWHLARFLDPKQWRFVDRDALLAGGQVDVMVLDGRHNWDKALHGVRTGLKSRIDCPAMTNKVELHRLLRGTGTTPESWTVGRWSVDDLRFDPGRRYIWRPEGGWKGQGVKVVTSKEQLDEMRRDLEDDERAVLSEYVERPLLLDGHKMSVRLYLVVATHRRGAALLTKGLLGIAPKPYIAGRWDDMAIHDARTLVHRDYRFPEDYPGDAGAFWAQAKHQFNEALRVVRPHAKSYAESKHGFEVLGCDLIVDAEYDNVYLVEMNHKPGHKQLDPAMQARLSDAMLTGVAQFALALPTPGVPLAYERVGLDDEADGG